MNKLRNDGFTIVELLIVIVVIGILAGIVIVSYQGVQGRGYDVSVQNDLRSMADSLLISAADTAQYPYNEAGLSVVGLKLAKGAYGANLVSGGMQYNVLYCSTVAGYSPSNFALEASSKSGKLYSITGTGTIQTVAGGWDPGGWGTICPALLNVSAGNSAAGVWIYENSIWKIWLQ
jgi:prepilin-type N-terminal cleavage/methylation domain-containing protein